MDEKEIMRLFGAEARAACERRGYDLRSLDEVDGDPSELEWYRRVRWRDNARFLDAYLPLIVRLFRYLAAGDPEADGETGAMKVVLESALAAAPRYGADPVLRGQIELTALLASRASLLATRSLVPDPLEVMIDLNEVVFRCLTTLERLPRDGADPPAEP